MTAIAKGEDRPFMKHKTPPCSLHHLLVVLKSPSHLGGGTETLPSQGYQPPPVMMGGSSGTPDAEGKMGSAPSTRFLLPLARRSAVVTAVGGSSDGRQDEDDFDGGRLEEEEEPGSDHDPQVDLHPSPHHRQRTGPGNDDPDPAPVRARSSTRHQSRSAVAS
jgi:hypothetical protein